MYIWNKMSNLLKKGGDMANLLQVNCLFCVYRHCAAVSLTKEVLDGIKKQDREVFDGIIFMNMLYVFCRTMKKFRAINVMG